MSTQTMESETDARARLAGMNNETLSITWLLTEGAPMTAELATVRGWISDELEKRMGLFLYDEWLFADEDAVDPLPFLTPARTA